MVVLGAAHRSAEPEYGRMAAPGSHQRTQVVDRRVLRDRRPCPRLSAVARQALEYLVKLQCALPARIDVRGNIDLARIARIQSGQSGIILLGRPKARAGPGQWIHLPLPAIQANVKEAMIAELAILRLVVGPGGNQSQRPASGVQMHSDCPGMGHRVAVENTARGKDFGQLRLGPAVAIENVAVDDRAVGAVELAALDVSVINAVVEIPRVMLGRQEIDTIDAVGGVLDVAVDVAEL